MKSINQCMQLMRTLKESRSLNGQKVNFVHINWVTSLVKYKYEDPNNEDSECDNKIPVWVWLSWHMWKYRGTIDLLNRMFKVGDSVEVVLSNGDFHNMKYFGDGVFSILNSQDEIDFKSTNLGNFNPETYYITDIAKVNELIILPNDDK